MRKWPRYMAALFDTHLLVQVVLNADEKFRAENASVMWSVLWCISNCISSALFANRICDMDFISVLPWDEKIRLEIDSIL